VDKIAIRIEGISKEYRLGVIGHGALYKDLQSWWARIRGKEDPNTTVGPGHASRADGNARFMALDDVSMDVEEGDAVGIIGRNGAGKSTLLKILSRVTAPTRGEIRINGRVASLLEVGTGFHPELTGRENVYLNGAILGMSRGEIGRKFDEIVDFSGVERFIDTPVKRYSSGMLVRLAFAVAAHLDPEILLVDEVLAVGDAEFQKRCLGKLGDVTKGGRTVLFVSHNMEAIHKLCKRAVLLDEGRIVVDDTPDRTITTYLDSNLVEGAAVSGSVLEDRLHGVIQRVNPYIRFREIALKDQSGSVRSSFSSNEEIRVSVTFECLQSVRNLWMTVQISDENNLPILESVNVDDPGAAQKFHGLKPGLYKASCILPADTFGSRNLYLTVQLIYPKTEHLIAERILGFTVKFKGYDLYYGDHSAGFVRPRLNWDLES
jgi:lipopolysaccharide transport system ATP-binding protein